MANDIKIKKGLKIGELDAESDSSLLDVCYVDNGQINNLLDLKHHASIILGRTGAGKSAMLYQISKDVEHSTLLDPNDKSIRFLEQSNIIEFFNELGINLDLFYRVLWRHILTVELLKLRYELNNEQQNRGFLNMLTSMVKKDPVRERALSYFTEWGDKFWLETDEQLRELTEKFTKDIGSKIKAKFGAVDVSLDGARNLTKEMKSQIIPLATRAVSSIQIQRLTEVLNLLADKVFDDKQKCFYILIDKLDENWAETETRCRFIRALIEETKSMRKIPQVKIITALRIDLLEMVFDKTRGSGFQEEKYEAYLMKVVWSRDDLVDLLSRRVKEVYKRQYTSEDVGFMDVFPTSTQEGGESCIDYILNRTFMRPRDAIQFVNECFIIAMGRPRVSLGAIRSAESHYSNKRMKSLFEEWEEYYPDLERTIEILRGARNPVTRSSLMERIQSLSEELIKGSDKDPCVLVAKQMYSHEHTSTKQDLFVEVISCLYQVGVLGVKVSTNEPIAWSYLAGPTISRSEVKRINQIEIHPMFSHSLEVKQVEILRMKPGNVNERSKQKKRRPHSGVRK